MQGTAKQAQYVKDPWSRWAGLSASERSRQRRQLLLDAAFELVAQSGVGDITIRAVCRQSGVHRRYFHESFESRDDLLRAMFDSVVRNVMREVIDSLAHSAGAKTRIRVHGVVHTGLSFSREHPAQIEMLLAGLDEVALREQWEKFVVMFRMLMSPSGSASQVEDVEDAVIAAVLEGAAVEFGRQWMAGEFGDDIETAAEVSSMAVLKLMKVKQPPARGGEVPWSDDGP